MSQLYPCPNPMCTHQFTAQDLSGVASVTCPRCGMVIQLRAAQPKPPAAPTVAMPQQVLAAPVAAAPVEAPDDPTAPIVRARPRARSRDALTYTLVIGGFLLLASFGVIGFIVSSRGGGLGRILGGRGGYKNSALNYHFDPNVSGWEENAAMKNAMGVSELVLRRGDAPAYFALDVLDYKDHNPSERELDGEARRKLKAMFPKNLETNQEIGKPDEAEPIAGQKSHRIDFHGESAEQALAGDVVFFANQGVGYWLYALAGGDAKAFEDEFKKLRKSFALIGERADFKKSQQNSKVYGGDKVKGYQLTDSTGRWKQQDDPAGHDPAADIVLRAPDPANPKKATLAVDVIVMSIKAGGDPVEAARKHLIDKYARDGNPGAKISDAGEGAAKDRVGEAKGHLLRWRVSAGGGYERFALVGVVPRADDVLVLFGDCPWDRRYTWEGPLQQLMESLQVKE
jgi:hypothetical protein